MQMPPYRARGVTEWLDEHQNDHSVEVYSHQSSTQPNIYSKIWRYILDRALHHHHNINIK